MPPILNVVALVGFAASLSLRGLDPVLLQIAGDLNVSIAKAAGISAATALAFAIVQPFLGAAADMFGKARIMIASMVLLGVANLVGAFATSFETLMAARIVTGLAGGGLFPVAVGLTGDLVAPEKRQVAIGRVLAGSMTGTLLGAALSGVVGDIVGWRGVLVLLGGLALLSALIVIVGFGPRALKASSSRADFRALAAGYREIFSNPNAPIVYTAVFLEGCCLLGLFPYVTPFLFDLGVTSLSIGGVVLSGFAVGGLIYTMTVSRLLARFDVKSLMVTGGLLLGLELLAMAAGLPWPVQALIMVGIGWSFYLLHGALQVVSTELSVQARASAVSLHNCFFFLGQTAGPIVYGLGLAHGGKFPTLAVAGGVLALTGLVCVRLLRWGRPATA